MFFCPRFSLSRSAMEDIERKTGGEKEMDRNRWCGRCMCVCGCWSLPIFMLIGWNGVQMEPGIGKETVEAVLQMRIWQVVEVILHCLLAAILKISTSHATSNNCFVEHIGPHSRELGACGGWKGGGGWCSLGLCARDRKDENGAKRMRGKQRYWGKCHTYLLSRRVWRRNCSMLHLLNYYHHHTHTHTKSWTHTHSYSTCFTFSACINGIKSVCCQIRTTTS